MTDEPEAIEPEAIEPEAIEPEAIEPDEQPRPSAPAAPGDGVRGVRAGGGQVIARLARP